MFLSFGLLKSEAPETTDLVKKVISNVQKNIPQMKRDLADASREVTTITRIVGSGFTYFKEQADMVQYNGVSDSNLIPFLNYLKSLISLPDAYQKYFVDNLSMILFSDFNEIVVYRVLFSADAGGDCHYVCVMGQRNDVTGKTDWLVGDVKALFKLAPDILYIEKSKSNMFGLFQTYETTAIVKPKSLTDEQLSTLFTFFEICVFERFGELLELTPKTHMNFLQ